MLEKLNRLSPRDAVVVESLIDAMLATTAESTQGKRPSVGRHLTTREAAAYIGTTYVGFDNFVRRHGVPHVRYGRHRRFTRETLDRVLKTMALRPASKR